MDEREPWRRGFVRLGDHPVDLDAPDAEAKIQKAYDVLYQGVEYYEDEKPAKYSSICPVCVRYIIQKRSRVVALTRAVPIRVSASDYDRGGRMFYVGTKSYAAGETRRYVHLKCAKRVGKPFAPMDVSLSAIQPTDDTSLSETAVHEAGHAVVAVLCGRGFDYATAVADDRGRTAGHVRPNPPRCMEEYQGVICGSLAGKESARIFLLASGAQDSSQLREYLDAHAEQDLKKAKTYAERLRTETGRPIPDLYKATLKLTRDTLRWHADSVIEVAALLSANRAITDKDVAEVLANAPKIDDPQHEQECLCCDTRGIHGYRKPKEWHRPKADDIADQFLTDWAAHMAAMKSGDAS